MTNAPDFQEMYKTKLYFMKRKKRASFYVNFKLCTNLYVIQESFTQFWQYVITGNNFLKFWKADFKSNLFTLKIISLLRLKDKSQILVLLINFWNNYVLGVITQKKFLTLKFMFSQYFPNYLVGLTFKFCTSLA